MTTLDITAAQKALKQYYNNQKLIEMTYKNAPLYAMLNKKTDFVGMSNYPLPFRFSNPQGGGATFATAQTNKRPSKYGRYELTRMSDYQLASISGEAILASQSDAGAFVRLATAEIDGAINQYKRRLHWLIYGDGTGSMGVTTSTVASGGLAVVTFTNVEDISKIEVNMTVEVRTSGGTLRTFTGPATNNVLLVTQVDRDLGVFRATGTLGEAVTAVSATAATDLVYMNGDYGTTASPSKISGLAAWVPSTAPTSTAFMGVDRTSDSDRLAGIRITSSGLPLDEAFIEAARRVGRDEATPDSAFCSFTKYAALEKTLGSRVIYSEVEVASVGFRGIKISGPGKPITVYPDKDCPNGFAYLLDMDYWSLYSLGEPCRILDLDSNKWLREASADAYEVRIGGYLQLGSSFPGSSAVMVF